MFPRYSDSPLRYFTVELHTHTWLTRRPPKSLRALAGRRRQNMLDVFTEIGRRTAPPISYGFTLSERWAWLRYFPALDSSRGLRLRPEWSDIDPHQKTILSDDFGVGLSMRILTDALKLQSITTTNYFLSRVDPAAGSLRRSGRRGPAKSPDFICFDKSGTVHVIECKGTQSSLKTLRDQLGRGVEQKTNVVFTKARLGERLVGGVFVPQHEAEEDATLMICDPVVTDGIEVDLPFEQIANIVMRGELASSLHLLGLPTLGNHVAMAEPRGRDDSVERELKSLRPGDQGNVSRVGRIAFPVRTPDGWESRAVDFEVELDIDALNVALDEQERPRQARDGTALFARFGERGWERGEKLDEVWLRSPLGVTIRVHAVE
jgi:hypothetical protein